MNLGLIILLFLIIAIWYETTATREKVIKICAYHCQKNELQLLDQTVALDSIMLQFNQEKNLVLYRKYMFEISQDGSDRYKGYIELLNKQVNLIHIEDEQGNNIIHNASNSSLH